MTYNVYLVEDEQRLNKVLYTYLAKEGWNIKTFFNGEDAVISIPDKPDIWILDIMLPEMDGYQLIKKIKAYDNNTPVIFISARDESLDKILGLEMGSDDYLAKPFLPRELVIRVQKLLARVYNSKSNSKSNTILYGEYEVNLELRTIKLGCNEIKLTYKEYEILSLLLQNIGQVFSRKHFIDKVWKGEYFGSDRTVDDLIRRLRKKLPSLNIETIYGYGYRMLSHEN